MGVNSKKTHPLQARFSKCPEAIHLHAEIDAIQNAIRRFKGKTDFLKESVLYVARMRIIKGRFEEANACPCEGCQKAIDNYEIKEVVHT